MANRFWVGGTGTWDAADTTHWASTSGGAGGQSVPVDGDVVTFDGSSGGGTVTLGYSPTVTSITMGAFTGTFNGSTYSPTMDSLSLTGTGVRTVNMGSGTWTLRGNNKNIFDTGTTTNLTFSAGTTTIVCSYSGSTGTRTFSCSSGGNTFNNVSITAGSDTVAFSNSVTVGTLDFTGFSGTYSIGTINITKDLTFSGTQTVAASSNVITFNGNGVTQNFRTNGVVVDRTVTIAGTNNTVLLYDDLVMGSSRTLSLTTGTFDANNKNITCAAFSSSGAGVRTITMGSGTWTLTGNNMTIWTTATTTNLTITANTATVNCTYAGAVGTRVLTTGASAAFGLNNVNITAGTDIVTLTGTFFCNDLDFNGFTGNLSNGSSGITLSGSLRLGSGMTTTSGTGAITFTATSPKTITSNSVQFNHPFTFDGVGGVWTLQDSLNMDGASIRNLTITNGSFNANNQNVTCGVMSSSNSNVRTLTMGSGTWTLVGTGNVWNIGTTTTNMTLNCGTSTIKITDTSASSKTFRGAGKTYHNLLFSGAGTGAFILVGNNTFNRIYNDNEPITVQFTAGSTTTLSSGSFLMGTKGSLVTVQSTTGGTAWNIVCSSGSVISDFISLQDSAASGGAGFYAGSHSTDVSGNSGWIFTQAIPTAQNAARDSNQVTSLLAAADSDGITPVVVYAKAQTHGLMVSDGTTGNISGNSNASRDSNFKPVLMAVSSVDGVTPVEVYADALYNTLLVKSS